MSDVTMLVILMLCFASVSWVVAKPTQQLGDEGQWQAWKKINGKSYKDKYEEKYRKAIWMTNLEKIKQDQNSERRSFTMELNNLADLTQTEYHHLMLGTRLLSNTVKTDWSVFQSASNDIQFPETVDWRTKGCVTPVKNQGALGKSWPFSATGSLEGQHCINTGKLASLDELKLANCCSSCMSTDDAFRYMIAHNSVHTEHGYFDKMDKNCNFSTAAYNASLTGYTDILSGSEYLLQAATAVIGPISIEIDASHQSFQLYHSGVYDEPTCSSTQLDHAVLVVGYGTLNGEDYWLVKNSWGTEWGMEGYIMMSRNKDNQCGIATVASYPTGVTSLGDKHNGMKFSGEK